MNIKNFLSKKTFLITIFYSFCIVSYTILCGSQSVSAQAGVVLPGAENTPNPSKLSLDEMTADIRIDHQFAHVKITQIYANHTNSVMEGRYIFNLPVSSTISDFAVWDGNIRIPGVILEVKRANQIYEVIKQQSIDPGLLTQEDRENAPTAFTVKLTPIPAYGTKRIELEYVEILPVEGLQTFFSLPLKPSQYGKQTSNAFRISLEILNSTAMSPLNLRSHQYPLIFSEQTSNRIAATFQANNVSFEEDFAFDYFLETSKSQVNILTYRAPERISANELRDPNRTKPDNDGYFETSAILNERGLTPKDFYSTKVKRAAVIMLDTSLSMQWDKLDKAYLATELFLKSLTPEDNFNLLLFNDDVNFLSENPLNATPENVEKALNFIKQSYLSGGTDFTKALPKAIELAKKFTSDEKNIVLLTDGNSTLSTTLTKRIVNEFKAANQTEGKQIARLYAFGIGSDTNLKLLKELAKTSAGYFDWGRETEELDFRLRAFFAKVGQKPLEGISLQTDNPSNFYYIYPDSDFTSYDGSSISFVGRYKNPLQNVKFSINGKQNNRPIKLEANSSLPELDSTHNHLPRLWARQRVDALLRLIELNGEDEKLISEIIALSKKYKFVTPYTAFIAASRSLLRPRIIKPGDPVLRVRTDSSIKSVIAVFPFGLSKSLTYLENENIWETRFLAPKEMQDGNYTCRLILTDENGITYEEKKSFIIDSHPPQLDINVKKSIQSGEIIEISVRADQDTRQISARFYGTQPIKIVWDEKRKINVGRLSIPQGLPPGSYSLVVTAEDFAHNVVSKETTITLL